MFKTKHNLIIPTLISCLALQPTHADEPSTEPILRIETGMHTAPIRRIGVDAAERFLLTASDDKTLRLWDLHTGDLLNIYRVPIDTGNEGKLYSGAISPDGEWVAGAGWTGYEWDDNYSIYLFKRTSGKLVKRLSGLENVISHLCFSPDRQYLGASLGAGEGVRIWDTYDWNRIFKDTDYGQRSSWCDFDLQNRLVTSSLDGYLRLYSSTKSDGFSLMVKSDVPGGSKPFAAVFSPTGDQIAVGFGDSTNVNVLDGHDLAFLYAPNTIGIDNGDLGNVTWSQDGNSLSAGGTYNDGSGMNPVLHWSQTEPENYAEWQASIMAIMDIRPLKNGSIVYGAGDPTFAVLDNTGNKIVEQEAGIVDYRGTYLENFAISHDGNTIHFGFEIGGLHPARFSLSEQSLILNAQPDTNLTSPDTTSLNITGWENTYEPKLNGKALSLYQYELSHSLAIVHDKSKFLVGTSWYLCLFDKNGQQIWKVAAPSAAWGVNISGDGKKAVAAFGDGTIRWYNLDNGEELLAFFPHKDGKRWIAWTPSGYYMSSDDNADNLIGWHVNKGKDKAARFYPAAALHATHKRPDIVKKMLETLDEDEAIRLDNLEKEGDVEVPVSVGEELAKVKKKYEANLEPSGLGKVIIIAAGGEHEDNTLFPYSNELTTEMYRILYKRGFTDGDIVYMNPYPPIVPVNAYVDAARQDFSLRDPKAELQQAFLQVGKELSTGQQFILYLHGHANPDTLIMNQTTNLSAQQLKILLDQIPTDVEQVIILDTCYSGSFLPELAGVENRIVITSADAKTQDWNAKLGSFSAYFFEAVDSGFNVKAAFKNAEDEMSANPKFFGKQRPQLDDTQDGLYDSSRDGEFARHTYFGTQKVHASLPPEITEIHPSIQLAQGQTTATLWMKAIPDFNGMKKVRAILVNEHDSVTQYKGENTDFPRRELTLKPNYNLQRYEIDFDQFHTANNWKILYQAQSMEGDWSETSVGYAVSESIEIAIKSQLNKTTYTKGDNLQFDVAMSGVETVDLYVGIIFPQGYYQTITHPLNFSMDNVLKPYQTGVQLTGKQTMPILNMELLAIAPGDYQVCGLLTQPQTEPNDEANWLHLDCKGFNFQ
jgi:WD40 repeat protein